MTVLAELVGSDAPSNRAVPLKGDDDWRLRDLDGVRVDKALREAEHQGLIDGRRQGTDGSEVIWWNVRLTVLGLRQIGEWPPPGSEHLQGVWDERYWGSSCATRADMDVQTV